MIIITEQVYNLFPISCGLYKIMNAMMSKSVDKVNFTVVILLLYTEKKCLLAALVLTTSVCCLPW